MKIPRRLFYFTFVISLLIVLWMFSYTRILPAELREAYLTYFSIVRALTIVVFGALFLELTASVVTKRLKHLGREVYLVRNVILVVGYIVLGLMILAIFEVTGISAVVGATVSGLVVGLGLQQILANLFAGLIILGTGFLKPGTEVKISGGLPLSPATLPGYKMFSRDEIMPTLRGVVVEVGLLHTKILSDSGEIVKIPNNMAFTSSVVMEEKEEPKTVRVRYEFPVEYDPDMVLERLQQALSRELDEFKIYVEEQSDKRYYIIIVVAKTPSNVKVRECRSKLLKQIIKVHRELIQSSSITDQSSSITD
ncbi:MAG: mechanosensitive ion channel family protein [Candidatus Bathyarchaeota archaeon]|nr:mechanosensitive ion channel family protein [Candidatus Bathyarchaeota archaeon]